MVGEGMGMTLLPELSIPKRFRKDDPISYVPFSNPKPSRRIGMLYRKGSYREETYKTLAEVFAAAGYRSFDRDGRRVFLAARELRSEVSGVDDDA